VSFHVDRGETLCIVGVSGCGKVLTALAVMNLLPARAKRAMYPARIVEEAETESYFRGPMHPYSAALLGSVLTPEPGLGVPAAELDARGLRRRRSPPPATSLSATSTIASNSQPSKDKP
jgi:ABC-type dipeptide/oligopeptide/nickel transport system ATPase component